jgi:WD repeat-containing protein 55
VLAVFNRAAGWADCVDRVPGHPHSVDALCALPAAYPSAHSTLLTGSSDGLLRAVQIFPTKLLGAVADHGAFPIERVRVDMGGQGRWVASVGHEEAIKMTDLREVFEDDEGDAGEDQDGGDASDDDKDGELDAAAVRKAFGYADEEASKSDSDSDSDSPQEPQPAAQEEPQEDADADADSDAERPTEKKRKRKQADPLQAAKRKKGRDQMDAERGFFSGL